MQVDRAKFFAAIRPAIFRHLVQSQVDGMSFILAEWEKVGFTDLRWLAYMLGTAYHETAFTMQPIKEIGSTAYFTRMYDITGSRPAVARLLGNVCAGDGPLFCGRGYVQATGRANYTRLEMILRIPLSTKPDLAMEPATAARIMFEGMTRQEILFENKAEADWTFSGRALEQFFNETTEDWVGARRIINGIDHAQMIADTAQKFYDAVDPQ